MSFSPSKSDSACLRSIWGQLTEIAISPEKIESVINQSVLFASGEVRLEFREVGPARMDDHDLPVDNCLSRNVEDTGSH
jgi:hypothetical protein